MMREQVINAVRKNMEIIKDIRRDLRTALKGYDKIILELEDESLLGEYGVYEHNIDSMEKIVFNLQKNIKEKFEKLRKSMNSLKDVSKKAQVEESMRPRIPHTQ
ncbi:MAG: hypothetical protein AB1765_11540 [Candidatus Hydrogenedentota bacterium]